MDSQGRSRHSLWALPHRGPEQSSPRVLPAADQVTKALGGTKRKTPALHDRYLGGCSEEFLSVDVGGDCQLKPAADTDAPHPAAAHPIQPSCEQPGNGPSFPQARNLSP